MGVRLVRVVLVVGLQLRHPINPSIIINATYFVVFTIISVMINKKIISLNSNFALDQLVDELLADVPESKVEHKAPKVKHKSIPKSERPTTLKGMYNAETAIRRMNMAINKLEKEIANTKTEIIENSHSPGMSKTLNNRITSLEVKLTKAEAKLLNYLDAQLAFDEQKKSPPISKSLPKQIAPLLPRKDSNESKESLKSGDSTSTGESVGPKPPNSILNTQRSRNNGGVTFGGHEFNTGENGLHRASAYRNLKQVPNDR